jgi:hypothetical protein
MSPMEQHTIKFSTAIVGEDFAGWTLDAYILPRLASGLHWAEEVLR